MKRWVVKAGSNMVCTGGPLLLRSWMQQVSQLRRAHGVEVVWVTSGAIASAVDRTHFDGKKKKKREMAEKQALAAIGQPIVMDLYNLALNATGLLGAQILLTYDDLADRERRQNFQNTVEQLLSWKVTPILNENDAVATQEIKFGDNDSLSAKVAGVVGAERLLILTDVDGYYDSDPKKNPGARLIPKLKDVSATMLRSVAPEAGSSRGTGGMYSKLKAAQEAAGKGIETWLIRGDVPSVLLEVARGKSVGTLIQSGGRRGK
jgi:glutamate 5-kinase